jgi:hypothetical protein
MRPIYFNLHVLFALILFVCASHQSQDLAHHNYFPRHRRGNKFSASSNRSALEANTSDNSLPYSIQASIPESNLPLMRCYIQPVNNFCTRHCHCTSFNLIYCYPQFERPWSRIPISLEEEKSKLFGEKTILYPILSPRTCGDYCLCERQGFLFFKGRDEKFWAAQGLDLRNKEQVYGPTLGRGG